MMNEDDARKVIDKLYSGVTLTRALDGDGTKIRSFYKLIRKIPLLEQDYMRAQQAKAELQVDQIAEIADTEPDPNRARVMIDARKWYASKMSPHKYGDRIDLNITQSIDISKALNDARSRVVLSTCYPINTDVTQRVDNKEILCIDETGLKPVDSVSDDIFS
jgi:hypothetical protein